MKKILSIFTCLVLTVSMLSLTAFADNLSSSFKKGHGFSYEYTSISAANRSTMEAVFPALVGTEVDGSVVGANDAVILNTVSSTEWNNYQNYANGISNVYIWKQTSDGAGVTKVYGGTGTYSGFYGYVVPRSSASYAIGNNTTSSISSKWNAALFGNGSAWDIKSTSSNAIVTFGKYNLDLNGVTVFTIKNSFYIGDWSCGTLFNGYLTQGDNAYSTKDPDGTAQYKQFPLFGVNRGGQLYYFASGGQVGTMPFNLGYNSESNCNTTTVIVDARGETPMVKVNYLTGTGTVYETGWRDISSSGFDFSKAMGIKLLVQDQTQGKNMLQLADFRMTKPVTVANGTYTAKVNVSNKKAAALSGKVVAALYDTSTNEMADVDLADVTDLAAGSSSDVTVSLDTSKLSDSTKYKIKYFLMDFDNNFFPLSKANSDAIPALIYQ